MTFILVFLFIIIFVSLLILGLVFSKIIIDVEEFNVSNKRDNIFNIYFNGLKINVKIYLFKILKIASIKINKEGIEIFGIKIGIDKIYKIESKDKIYNQFKQIIKTIKDNYKNLEFIRLKPNLKRFKMRLNVGTENATITSFLVFIISMGLTYALKKSINRYSEEKYNYQILPVYSNTNHFYLDLNSKLSFNTFNLLLFIKKYEKIKNNVGILKLENRNFKNKYKEYGIAKN
ncbi:MAG: hypothetical protein HFJ46_07750 [Clostridia bacterium]|nr:hypothetical protein [Clostridia bacterium]